MTTLSYALTDSATMLRRSLRHMLRYPSMTVQLAGMPVVFLLLFVYVFGGTLGNGIGGGAGGRAAYVNYVAPGIMLMTVSAAVTGTAISVAMDMTEGLGIGIVAGVALLVGFRPTADAVEWVAAVGILAMITFAFTWLSVALGMVAKTVESASNLPMPLVFLPFLGSGFVPTDSMPAGLRAFAEYQPFTPFIETVRGLLMGTPIGSSGVITVAWCAAIALAGYLWAKKLFNRDAVSP